MSEPIDIKATEGGGDIQHTEKGIHQVEDAYNLDNDAKLEAYKAAAIEAETAEQQSGVLQAVKEYPMAAFWAFVMSCTIVSVVNKDMREVRKKQKITNTMNSFIDHGVLLCLPCR